ncbi:PhzF family phenazine biosynthesis protein [Synechococcus sp. BO 8801]|uniref:PhzF family phenazine biosynthesis protein n=1 Tax=Synechococcus sp. BO 8801 TaxID=169670 RepID=UPI000B98EBEB|nr:PhzF family phenazine biosynthesis protein [Synechococcus sp. BO 8801]
MRIPYYHIDSFTQKIFTGNPAGVCILDYWLSDETMMSIAKENGLAETAFIVGKQSNYKIRWFTPDIEMDLCGHATLAAAHVVANYLEPTKNVTFRSNTDELNVGISDGRITMLLPRRVPESAIAPELLLDSVSLKPSKVLKARDYLFIYDTEDEVARLQINTAIFNQINLDPGGLCVSSVGSSVDFVSRYFTPQSTILEDPVTGSAHCSLIPYWSDEIGKRQLRAKQISARGGDLYCEDCGDCVSVAGYAVTYKTGEIEIDD